NTINTNHEFLNGYAYNDGNDQSAVKTLH
ncbi:unnamed protein product, partial [Rotaria sp. Silwood1]